MTFAKVLVNLIDLLPQIGGQWQFGYQWDTHCLPPGISDTHNQCEYMSSICTWTVKYYKHFHICTSNKEC